MLAFSKAKPKIFFFDIFEKTYLDLIDFAEIYNIIKKQPLLNLTNSQNFYP